MAAGTLSDRIGRVPLFKIGFVAIALWVVPMFLLIETATLWGLSLALLGLVITQSFAYGQQAAAFVEMFPARVRFTGASLGYALGAVIGGGFAPTIASALQNATGSTLPIAGYLALWSLIALTVIWNMKDRTGQPISASDSNSDHDQLISKG
jgi:nitrate/nitrite transporter NarK